MTMSINGTNGLTFNDASTQNTAATGFGFKNRIINGAMVIDQRNSGASVSIATGGQYTLDRWVSNVSQASKITIQKNAGAITPPINFTNYLGCTSTSAYTLGINEAFTLEQVIEGYNIADFNWGSANAQAATLSFWVRSSLTGTFGGSLATANGTIWVLPFSFSIATANTWIYITVAIPAGTSSLPFTDNGAGIYVRFCLGASGTKTGGTSGVWTSANNYTAPAGSVSVVGTNGATFYVTGVQLEKGSTATTFDYRPYGTELALCQRYYQASSNVSTYYAWPSNGSGTYRQIFINLPVVMRATPSTVTLVQTGGLVVGVTSASMITAGVNTGNTTSDAYISAYTISSEL